jgi:recombination protein RecR
MIRNDYPSKVFENAVNEFSKLPGIGQKTALRLVLYLLKKNNIEINAFGSALMSLAKDIKYCKICHNLSDEDICTICNDKDRDHRQVCVVESVRDVMAIENTRQYNGVYHVLGGIISPMDGIGPSDLSIESLEKKAASGSVKEVIFALSATMEGDTTNYYIYKKLKNYNLQISAIARGVAVGDELEYADEVTLGRSIVNRTPFDNQK